MKPGGRQFGVVLAGLFLIAWVTAYNAAVMCGDDVTHLRAAYGNDMYLPNFSWLWIPNRVFDLYSRNLTAEMFDAVYFPSHALSGIEFFGFYKLFSATMFAVFVCFVFGYLRRLLDVFGGGRGQGVLFDAALAGAVLLVLPWTNQVRLLCYELPAFLSFVLLVELTRMLHAGAYPAAKVPRVISPASLILLSFIVAFSLEAYAAIMLAVLGIAGLCLAARRRDERWLLLRRRGMRPGLAVAVSLGLFNLLALLMTVLFSGRPVDVHRDQPLTGLHLYVPGPANFEFDVSLCGVLVAVGIVLGFGAVLACRYFRWRFDDGRLVLWALFILVLAATLIVVGLISLWADQNYFDFISYPWGGLTLILQLMGLLIAGLILAPSDDQGLALKVGRMFFLFVLVSRMAIAVLSGQAAAAQRSDLVEAAYAQVISGAHGLIETGLSLDAIPLQARPLPTADSPGWFIRNYQGFFRKYYGVDFDGSFK